MDTLFATIKQEFGHLDGVFVTAGYSEFLLFEEVTEQSFDKVIGVNFKGAYFAIQKALPLLRPGSSVIINSSVGARARRGGRQPRPSQVSRPPSCISLEILSAELVDRGIRVNTLSPGPTDTAISVASPAKSRARRLRMSSEPTIQASGWPIRRKSRSWRFTLHRTIIPNVNGADFLIDGGVTAISAVGRVWSSQDDQPDTTLCQFVGYNRRIYALFTMETCFVMETVIDQIESNAEYYRGYLTHDRSLIPLTIALVTVLALWFLIYLVSAVGPQPGKLTAHPRRMLTSPSPRPVSD